MIELCRGDLLEASAEALVNTVNCVGVMGKGVALLVKRAYPENFRRYREACAAGEVKPGRMLVVPTGSLVGPRYIINFPTKRHWKGKSRIEDIRIGLPALVDEIRRLNIRSIAVPALGCGNGGLDWSQVRPLIEAALAPLSDVHILLFEPPAVRGSAQVADSPEAPNPTRAQALMLLLMDAYRAPGYRLSSAEVRKLAYFLRSAGESLPISFEHGPSAQDKDVDKFLEPLIDWFVHRRGTGQNEGDIIILPGAVDAARAAIEKDGDAVARLKHITCLIEGFESPYSLELLAGVHWALQEQPASVHEHWDTAAVIDAWNQPGREIDPAHIDIVMHHLHERGRTKTGISPFASAGAH